MNERSARAAAVSLRDLSDARSSFGRQTDLIDDIDTESAEIDALTRMMNVVLTSTSHDLGLDEITRGLAVVADVIRTKTKANAERANRLWQIARAGLVIEEAVAEEVRAEKVLREADAAAEAPRAKRRIKAA